MPYKWLTPNSPPPDDERGRCFSVPDDVELIAAVSGALLPLTYAANWEQFGSMTPDEAASIMSAAFEAFVESECGKCIPAIAGKRLVRLSPTTQKFEQIADDGETWEEPAGDLAVPAQIGRDEPTDDEKICAAAANAAHVIHLLYDKAIELYENEIDPAAALDFWGDYSGEIIFEALGTLVSHFSPLVGYMWTTLYGIMEILTYAAWTDTLEGNLTCLLLDNASIDGDVVTFDYPAVQTGVFTSAYTSRQDLLVLGQVWYFLAIIGSDGLNLAGETTGVEAPVCLCNDWCFESEDWSDWDIMRGGVILNSGVGPVRATSGNPAYGGLHGSHSIYAELERYIDTSECQINSFEVKISAYATAYACWTQQLVESTDPQYGTQYKYTNVAVPTWVKYESSAWESDTDETRLYVAMTDDSNRDCRIVGWRLLGIGKSPFGASNC